VKRITVLLVDDPMIVREGFRKLLELEDDLEVVGDNRLAIQVLPSPGRASGKIGGMSYTNPQLFNR
jgi:DNA-binding NarL/FixJ family response regulator